jgi:proteasome lid subunit RPN8/RPN11
MRISRAEVEKILAHARSGYPFEVCGVLLGRRERRIERSLPVTNRETENPRRRYLISPEDHLKIQKEARQDGLEILGFYHSHPDHPARPSETDREIAAQGLSDGVIHVVVGVEKGERATPTAWIFRDETQGFEEEPFEAE